MKLLLIVVFGTLMCATLIGSRVAVTLLAIQGGSSPFAVGVLFALHSLPPLFVGIAMGRWIDRAGVRHPLLVCGVLMTGALLLAMALPAYWSYALCALVVGGAYTFTNIGLNAVAAELGTTSERTANLAWFMLGNSAGFMVAPLLTGFGIDLLGPRATFALVAGFPVLMLLLVLGRGAWLDNVLRAAPSARGGRLLDFVLRRKVLPIVVLSVLAPTTFEIFMLVAPLIGSAAGLSASQIGVVLSSAAAIAFATRVALPALSRHVSEWTVAVALYACGGTLFLMLSLAGSMAWLLVVATVAGIAHGVGNPVLMSLFCSAAPPGRQGEMIGLRSMLGAGVHSALPVAVGALSTLLGMGPVLWMVGAGGYALSWYARRSRRAARSGTAAHDR